VPHWTAVKARELFIIYRPVLTMSVIFLGLDSLLVDPFGRRGRNIYRKSNGRGLHMHKSRSLYCKAHIVSSLSIPHVVKVGTVAEEQ